MKEPLCVKLCPGDLIMIKNEKSFIRDPGDCWDCMACVKSCPYGAIETKLPYELGYKDAHLIPKRKGKIIVWELVYSDGRREVFERQVRL
jgi:adenylylsulfate reductase subunit B